MSRRFQVLLPRGYNQTSYLRLSLITSFSGTRASPISCRTVLSRVDHQHQYRALYSVSSDTFKLTQLQSIFFGLLGLQFLLLSRMKLQPPRFSNIRLLNFSGGQSRGSLSHGTNFFVYINYFPVLNVQY